MTASLSRADVDQIVARARADKSQPNLQICQTDRDKMARAWDEGADFARRHPFMSSEYIRSANPYRTEETR